MTDQWTSRLSEYLDGELPEQDRAALEAHLQQCVACRDTLEELRLVVTRAEALDDRPPAADLWGGIAARIGSRVGTPSDVVAIGSRRPVRRFTFSVPQLAAAAVVLLLVGAGAAWLAGPAGGPAALSGAPEAAVPVEGVGLPAAAQAGSAAYDGVVAELTHLLEEHREQLDSATARVLDESLAAIDRAIAEAEAALATDPANAYLSSHLAETKRRKVQLLRRAAALATVSS